MIKALLVFCAVWSLLVLALLMVTAARRSGDDTLLLIIGTVPMAITAIVGIGVLVIGRIGRVAAAVGLVLSALVACGAMVSFVTPALVVLPVCAVLLAACVVRLQV